MIYVHGGIKLVDHFLIAIIPEGHQVIHATGLVHTYHTIKHIIVLVFHVLPLNPLMSVQPVGLIVHVDEERVVLVLLTLQVEAKISSFLLRDTARIDPPIIL